MVCPQNLSYNYLVNGTNVLNGYPVGTVIHPAITTIGYVPAVTWVTHVLFGKGLIYVAVIGDPEFYFSVSAHSVTLLTALSLYLTGRWAHQGLRSHLPILAKSQTNEESAV